MQNKQDLIPFDYLHRIEGEKNWCLLSEDELSELIEIARENGYNDIDSIVIITRWAEETKCGEILYKLLRKRQLKLEIRENEVYFKKA
jgi:hypothetical protein|tara:strand:- start:158 stop:421 length:264 start_codon:yes stop_codon:yes gene_type:complete